MEHAALGHAHGVGGHAQLGVARVGIQVAEALAFAHAHGVHRDVKPSNLLLDPAGTVWVTNFGLAKANADERTLTHSGDVTCTLRYMAPERFKGKSDARGVLYSLGVTLYKLLTLRDAFEESAGFAPSEEWVHFPILRHEAETQLGKGRP